MSKFIIECPECGKFAEAKTGIFASKKIQCGCGHIINLRTEKMASRQCPHCGNMVVFDQSKGSKAKCPVCHEPINSMTEQTKVEEISCAQCGIRLTSSKGAAHYTCPVCGFENDVQERLMTEKIRKDGLASVIKYEGDNETLVWKHPIEDFNLGSQLIVHESQEAVFFRDGQALDLFGAGRYTLETQQLPLLESMYQLPTDTEGTFHSEVYFVNTTTQLGIKWGTDSKVRLFDPASGLYVELGACGEFNIRVTNARKLLLKLVGTADRLGQEELLGGNGSKGFFRGMVMAEVKSLLAKSIRENQINVLEIDERLMELSNALREAINVHLEQYGLTMPEFFVSRVVTPDDDPNFRRMKEQFAEQYLLVRQEQIRKSEALAAAERKEVEAQTAAKLKIISAQAEAAAYKMKAEAEATEMKMKGFTYQQETARQVGLEAMQNGLGGGEAGALGDLAGLGVSLGAMGGVIGMTRDAMAPIMESTRQVGQTVGSTAAEAGWSCACGQQHIMSNFCPNCGAKRPEEPKGWDCACGQQHIMSNFCPNCGSKRPEEKLTWDCTCGQKEITSSFCPNCGKKKGE